VTNEDLELFDNLISALLDREAARLENNLLFMEIEPWHFKDDIPPLPGHLSYDDLISHLKNEAEKYRHCGRSGDKNER